MEDKNRELNVEELEQGAGGNITYKEFEEKAKQQMRQAKDQVGRRWNGSGDRTGAGHWRIASGIQSSVLGHNKEGVCLTNPGFDPGFVGFFACLF